MGLWRQPGRLNTKAALVGRPLWLKLLSKKTGCGGAQPALLAPLRGRVNARVSLEGEEMESNILQKSSSIPVRKPLSSEIWRRAR
jgi:hypothetical protein